MSKTDLIIIGGGAAGLMAGAAAGELGLKTLGLERKHKPGRKLLMCGNARCNLTTNISEDRMIQMFGDPVGPFLSPALKAFSPSAAQRWFAANGLKTVVKAGNKVYPHTERASDVLNLFTDRLRDGGVSLACSAVVLNVEPLKDGFRVTTDNFVVEGKYLLVATGGVSYPKTGSVGDGQQWAEKLGHGIEPYRPGLIGFEVDPGVIKGRVALLDPAKLGLVLTVFILIRTQDHSAAWLDAFRSATRALSQIQGVYRMTGDLDYLIRAQVADMADYDLLYQSLINRVTLSDVSASFVMEEIKDTHAIPL